MVKNLPANAGAAGGLGSIPGSGRSPEGGNGNSFQYFCLDNPMDRGAWQVATVRQDLATKEREREMATLGFPGGSDGKESACNAGDLGSIPGSGSSPGEGNGNPLQDSCLENPKDGGAWWATVHGVAKSRTRLNNFTFTFSIIKVGIQCLFKKYLTHLMADPC